jgi:hypothetical protein
MATQIGATVIFAFSINAIWEIVSDINKGYAKYQGHLNAINRFMRDKSVDDKLKREINEYLGYYWKNELQRDDQMEKEIIQKLTPNL